MTDPARPLARLVRWAIAAVVVLAAGLGAVSVGTRVGRPFPGFRYEPMLVVSSFNLQRWVGTPPAVEADDQVVAVDHVPVTSAAALRRAIETHPVGTVVPYDLRRDGRPVAAALPTRLLTGPDAVESFGPLLALSLVFGLIGLVGLVLRPGHPASQANASFSFALSTWASLGCDLEAGQWVPRLWLACYPWMAAALLHLSLVFPEPGPVGRRRGAQLGPYLLLAPVALACELTFRPRAVGAGAVDAYLNAEQVALAIIAVAFLVTVGAIAWRAVRLRGRLRAQARIALLGLLGAFLPAVIGYIGPTLMGSPPSGQWFIDFILLCFAIFPASIAYAIVRAQLFDITVVIKRTLTFTAVTALLATTYFGLAASLQWVLDAVIGPHGGNAAQLASTAALVLLFAPVRDRVQRLVERLFDRHGYDLTRLVTEFTASARETLDLEGLVQAFARTVDGALHPRRLEVWLVDEDARWGAYHAQGDNLALSPLTAAQLAEGGLTRSVPAADGHGTELAVPLAVNTEVLGLVKLGPRRSDQEYDAEDRLLIDNLSQQLGLAVRNVQLFAQVAGQERMRRDLEIAAEVQHGLLPKALPQLPDLGLAVSTQPAFEVGGDFYDLIRVDEDRWGIVLGDVAGKGVPAALMSAVCLTIFRSVAPGNPSAAEVLTLVNALLHAQRPSSKFFVAAAYAVLDVRQRHLTVASAGLPGPVIGGEVLPVRGLPLGAAPATGYNEVQVALKVDDIFLCYTDGLEDAMAPDGDRFGHERILEASREAASAEELHARLRVELLTFTQGGTPFDDITLLALGKPDQPIARPRPMGPRGLSPRPFRA